jgi:hypothetical protein
MGGYKNSSQHHSEGVHAESLLQGGGLLLIFNIQSKGRDQHDLEQSLLWANWRAENLKKCVSGW